MLVAAPPVSRSAMTPENTPEGPPQPDASSDADLSETSVLGSVTPGVTPRPASASGTGQAWVGKSLGKYRVTGVLGQGGMGIVLKAHDPLIERDVAIKILAEH